MAACQALNVEQLIRDILFYCNSNDLPLAVVNLDQKKAFDSVDHGYLFNTMRAMGFGDCFIRHIEILYGSAESLVKVGGSLTSPFSFEKGIRQGCPLSGLLYSIAIEPLLNKLRQKLTPFSVHIPDTNSSISSKAIYNVFHASPPSPSSSHWHENGFLNPGTAIQWKQLYHLPSTKKEDDVQFKLFHNILPSLAVLSHFVPDTSASCGWCGEPGSIQHLFITCPAIQPTLTLLHLTLSRLLPSTKLNLTSTGPSCRTQRVAARRQFVCQISSSSAAKTPFIFFTVPLASLTLSLSGSTV